MHNLDNKIGIIGVGYVGNAILNAYEKWEVGNIHTYDKNSLKSNCKDLLEIAKKSQYIFICLPTPMEKKDKKYKANFSIVTNTIKIIDNICGQFITKNRIILIKSTVLPSVLEKLKKEIRHVDLIAFPEFLSEDTAEDDFLNPKRVIYGADDKKLAKKVCNKLSKYFLKDKTKYYIVGLEEAMKIKYAANCFSFWKVLYFNLIYNWAGDDKKYKTLIKAILDSGWVGSNHTKVPYKNKYGVNGNCLPKDFNALFNEFYDKKLIGADLFEHSFNLNELIRKIQLKD